MDTDIVCYLVGDIPYQQVTTKDSKGRVVGISHPMPAGATEIDLHEYNRIVSQREQQAKDVVANGLIRVEKIRKEREVKVSSALQKLKDVAGLTDEEIAALTAR